MPDPLVITPKTCQGLTWHPPTGLGFAADKALIPLHAGELAKASSTLPVAAQYNGRHWQLVAVCGLTPTHNLFVKEGQWLGQYRPAWLATYPFEVVRVGEKGVLTFDKASGLLGDSGEGQPLLGENGELGPSVKAVVEHLKAMQDPLQATERALAALHRAGVLTPWPSALQEPVGMHMPGLYMLDESTLMQLPDEAFLALRKAQALPIAYALNLSLPQVHLLNRLNRLNPGAVDAPENLDSLFDNDEDLSFDFDD